MTNFFMNVSLPENRHVWNFLDSDADGAEAQVSVSIPKREWMPTDTFEKTDTWANSNPDASINDLVLYLVSLFDVEGHKWLKANKKKIPVNALGIMWTEFQNSEGLTEGESGASTDS